MIGKTLTTRPLSFDDAREYASTATAIARRAGTDERYDVDDTLMMWREPRFDLGRSSLGMFSDSGTLAAYVIVWAVSERPVRPWVIWGVHPDFHGHKLGKRLFDGAEERAGEIIKRCPPEARVRLQTGTPAGYSFAEKALAQAGYVSDRTYFDMRITMNRRPQVPDFPAGIAIKPYRHEEDLPLFVDIFRNSFSDHYGYVEEPFDDDVAEFRHWFNNDKNFEPGLVLLAVDERSKLPVGCLLAMKESPRHPGIGFVDIVGVRRGYRRRGLAQAMLYHSFATYWDRGLTTVSLEVDGSSLTNAVALYEKVGMHVHQSFISYEKTLRDGVELAKISMD